MKDLSTQVKRLLKWRRAQVLELSSQGYSDREIGSKLQISNITVYRDLRSLRKLAQDNLQKHIHEVVPEEYQKCMAGMKSNLRETLEIAATVSDPRVKLQARAIANDCYKFILDMSTNAGIVSDALKYVTQKTEQVNDLQKLDEQLEEEEEATTTSGIY
jgi:IS30 family transposase